MKLRFSKWSACKRRTYDYPTGSRISDIRTEPVADGPILLQTFRNDDGISVQDRSIRLQLRDFAPSICFAGISEKSQSSTVVEITYQKLCSFLHVAESRDQVKKSRRGVQSTLPPNCKKRRRELTPPEVLSPSKEDKVVEQEKRNAARVEAVDPTWR
jgi:hypothetical protein